MTLFLSILGALPAVVSLLQAFFKAVDAYEQKGIGRQEAIAAALAQATADMAIAKQAEQQAQADHATKDDDSAFDQSFKRTD